MIWFTNEIGIFQTSGIECREEMWKLKEKNSYQPIAWQVKFIYFDFHII